jgi:hypothetical protein
MKRTIDVELTIAELYILRDTATAQWRHWDELVEDGNKNGWYDAKSKDRILTKQHTTWELVQKLQKKVKEVENG